MSGGPVDSVLETFRSVDSGSQGFFLVSAALNVFIHDPLALSAGQSLELQTGFLNGQREDPKPLTQ